MTTKNKAKGPKVSKLGKARAVFNRCKDKSRANVLPKIQASSRGMSPGMAARYFQIVRSE